MNQFYREFTDIEISTNDVDIIKSLMLDHSDNKVLDYHGYIDLKKSFRTTLAKKLKDYGKLLDLRLAGIYAFTSRAGSVTSIHIDGDKKNGPLPWRLSFYVEGEPGILSWYDINEHSEYNDFIGAYIIDKNLTPLFSKTMDVKSAFVRTDIPHKLDISHTTIDRLTITATFSPDISWEELNYRIDNVYKRI